MLRAHWEGLFLRKSASVTSGLRDEQLKSNSGWASDFGGVASTYGRRGIMRSMFWLVLVVLLGLVLGNLNRDFMNRQSRPGEEWSRDPTGNIPPVDKSFEKPSSEQRLL